MTQSIETRTSLLSRPQAMASSASSLVILAAAVQALIGVATSTIYPALAERATSAFVYSGAILTLTHLMVLGGVAGLAVGTAAGTGWFKRVAFALALVGLSCLVLGEGVLRVNFDLGNTFFGIASPLSAVGMILVGIAVLRAASWAGWHRLTPLACGLYVPVVLIPAFVLAKGPSFWALAGWAICFLFLGLAMRAEQENIPAS